MQEDHLNVVEMEIKDEIVGDDMLNEKNYQQEIQIQAIYDELIEEAIWEVCFTIHRSVKLDYYDKDFKETEEKTLRDVITENEKDFFGLTEESKPTNIYCPKCKKGFIPIRFASHLSTCLFGKNRSSSIAASKKFVEGDESSHDSEGSDKPKPKNKRNKHSAKRRSARKKRGSGSFFTEINDLEMTYEQRKLFFEQKCGVISRHTNKKCMNSCRKCSIHTNEQRDEARQVLLNRFGHPLVYDGQIDVDTVDEKIDGLAYSMQANSIFSSENASICDFNETKSLTSSKSDSTISSKKKKSSSSSSSNSTPSPLDVSEPL